MNRLAYWPTTTTKKKKGIDNDSCDLLVPNQVRKQSSSGLLRDNHLERLTRNQIPLPPLPYSVSSMSMDGEVAIVRYSFGSDA